MPEISVIMSVYNDSRYLVDSIGSVLNQTFKDLEFIIIDDASTDDSPDIIRRYQEKDSRIRVIENTTNIGPGESKNKGLNIAKGRYIAIQDGDDISLKDRLKTQIEYLEKNSDIFLIGGSFINITDTGERTTVYRPITDEAGLRRALENGNPVRHSTVMFRNRKTAFYRKKFIYAEDDDFLLNILSKGERIINIPDILIKYRIAHDSITFSDRGKQELFARKAREFYFQRLKSGGDKYDEFNPEEILRIDIKKVTDRDILRLEIKANFKKNAFGAVRLFYLRYLRNNTMPDRYFIYYLATFLPKRIVNFLRRILWG
ncbi:MAG: hypothetical protein A2Z72_08080 [Omnitrophica bacterium RBG_13_46_9]|nr:MAG: hypothetical protein A2Z72_08080 [Omnitrophica bacterium RBG_13_46_9]